jgi:hypothetical protein
MLPADTVQHFARRLSLFFVSRLQAFLNSDNGLGLVEKVQEFLVSLCILHDDLRPAVQCQNFGLSSPFQPLDVALGFTLELGKGMDVVKLDHISIQLTANSMFTSGPKSGNKSFCLT